MKLLGKILWEMGRAEASALSVLTLVQEDRHLTRAEQGFIVDRMIPEERRHAAETRRWAATWARPPRAPRDAFGALVAFDTLIAVQVQPETRFAGILAITHWNEQNTLKAYDRYLPLFAHVSADLARDFTQIRDEEAGHVTFGRALIARLEREDPVMFRRFSVLYPLVRRVYSTIVDAAHTQPLRQLERALRPPPPVAQPTTARGTWDVAGMHAARTADSLRFGPRTCGCVALLAHAVRYTSPSEGSERPWALCPHCGGTGEDRRIP